MLNNNNLKNELKRTLKDPKVKNFLVTFDGFIFDIKDQERTEEKGIEILLKSIKKYFEHELPKNKTWKNFNENLKENFFLRILLEFFELNNKSVFWHPKFSEIKSKHIYDDSYENFEPTSTDILTQDEEYENDSKEIIKTIEEFSKDYKIFNDEDDALEQRENQADFYLQVQFDKNKADTENVEINEINLFIDTFLEIVDELDSDILTYGAIITKLDMNKISYSLRDFVKKSIPEEYHKFLKINLSEGFRDWFRSAKDWVKSKENIIKSSFRALPNKKEEVVISFLLELTHMHRNLEDYNFSEEDKVKIFIENFYEHLRHKYGIPKDKIRYFYHNREDKSQLQKHPNFSKNYFKIFEDSYEKIKKSIEKYSYILQNEEKQEILDDLKTIYHKIKKIKNSFDNKSQSTSLTNSLIRTISQIISPQDDDIRGDPESIIFAIVKRLKETYIKKNSSNNIINFFRLLQKDFGIKLYKTDKELAKKEKLSKKIFFDYSFIDFFDHFKSNLGSYLTIDSSLGQEQLKLNLYSKLDNILKRYMNLSNLFSRQTPFPPTRVYLRQKNRQNYNSLILTYVDIPEEFRVLFNFKKLINNYSIIDIKKLLDNFYNEFYGFDIFETYLSEDSLDKNEGPVGTIFQVFIDFRNWIYLFLNQEFFKPYIPSVSFIATDTNKIQRQIQQVEKSKREEENVFSSISDSIVSGLKNPNPALKNLTLITKMQALFDKDIKDLEEGQGGNFKNYSKVFIDPIKEKLNKDEQLTSEELQIIGVIEKTKPFLQSVDWSKVRGSGSPIDFNYYKDIYNPLLRPPKPATSVNPKKPSISSGQLKKFLGIKK